MADTKHTPLKLTLDTDGAIIMDGQRICTAFATDHAGKEQIKANNARVVKCWNLHPELVDVLQTINEQIERTGSITITKSTVVDTAIKMVLKQQAEK